MSYAKRILNQRDPVNLAKGSIPRRKSPARRALTDQKKKLWKLSQRCFYCRKPLTFETATVDHVIPRSKGGLTRLDNLVLSCEPCNVKKGNK